MDNKQFVVNGRTKEQLKLALDSLLLTEYNYDKTVKGWYINPKKGFILTDYITEKCKPFTNNMGINQDISKDDLLEILWNWLDTDEAKNIEKNEKWEHDADHDGHNELGWKLYTEDWGHVNIDSEYSLDTSSIAAFKSVFCWYGK